MTADIQNRVDLDELDALLEKATPRPWQVDREEYAAGFLEDDDEPLAYPCGVGPFSWAEYDGDTVERVEADVAIIAGAVNALPAMIAELRGLREAIECACARGHEFTHDETRGVMAAGNG